ncbi:MAG: hypothetical protein CFE24_10110 [Flavobacterium sp. BFFFF2]|nr:MAG: hypothetical protein CFE24_10110 [Flavobacterium sp. BFFFF2]
MKMKFLITLITFLVCSNGFSQNKELIQNSNLEKILVEFPIPYKDALNTFKKLKSADDYFYSANIRTKRKKSELDSTTIYIAIREYQYSIKLDQKHWASYRNISRLFVMINRKDLALISIAEAIRYSKKEDRASLYKMKSLIETKPNN